MYFRAAANTVAEECIGNVRTVKSFATEIFESNKFAEKNTDIYKVGMYINFRENKSNVERHVFLNFLIFQFRVDVHYHIHGFMVVPVRKNRYRTDHKFFAYNFQSVDKFHDVISSVRFCDGGKI